ncbi:nitrogen regulation protein NR(II) [Desulfovibrio sp. JC022]|uniref:two-component system sensor histidine kinase NtrB n=1 Tax=Desulfovibrio sp. JC022 TaxID=2593642 RepID=UPI0013D5766B|nr:PAS domain S-box protein [Desulfovibrio sp. JC022]NDV22424.1 PAS domain S-box protein [Desulfovibrio sp. JC022]
MVIKNSPGRSMLLVYILFSAFLWVGDSIFDFLWFNADSQDLGYLLFPYNNPHEIYLRCLMVSAVLLSGAVASFLFGRAYRSEEAARESEEKLKTIFNSIGDAIIATDATGVVTRMNPVAERLTGWSVDDAVGCPLSEVFKIINAVTNHPCVNPVEKVLKSKGVVGLANHTSLLSRSGEEFQIADSAAPVFNQQGDISGTVLVFRDVSEDYRQREELRRLRNYLSNIIDSMPSILVGVDAEGHVTQWNMTAEKVTGISSVDAQGKSLVSVFPRMASEMDKVKESIRSRQPRSEERKTRQGESGVCYEDVTIYPLIANGVEGAVIQIDDVTERCNMEQMMIQTEKMMSVGGLAAGMAHEINNPLAAIAGNSQNILNRIYKDLEKNRKTASECNVNLENLREYLSKRDIPKMLTGISESCNRAGTIVSNMLRFSRKSERRFGLCNLAELMNNTIDLAANDYDLKREYDFRKIEIIKEYSPDLSGVVCEENEIQQVFLNLLKNGAQAMMEKEYVEDGPCFVLRLKRDGNMAVIEVEDNGPGMTDDVRKRVFEPFYSTKSVGHGTGLGLSVSYFIVTDQHNGFMEVNSVPGSWTRFGIKIPISEQEA